MTYDITVTLTEAKTCDCCKKEIPAGEQAEQKDTLGTGIYMTDVIKTIHWCIPCKDEDNSFGERQRREDNIESFEY